MKLNIKKVKIGGKYYNIEYVTNLTDEKGNNLSGRIFEINSLIKICIDGNCQNELQTLLHECVHGICWEYGVKDIEDFVAVLSNAFYALMVDNSKYIQKILDYTKKLKK